MHLTVETIYPAGPDVVAAMLADASFVRWRASRADTGTTTHVDVTGSAASGFSVALRRTLPTDGIPAQVRAVVGDRLEVRQAEAWEAPAGGRQVGTVAVEIAGAPVRLTGTLLLEPSSEGGTRHVVDGDVHASIPLFASAVEEAAARAVQRTLEAEAVAAREWLDRT